MLPIFLIVGLSFPGPSVGVPKHQVYLLIETNHPDRDVKRRSRIIQSELSWPQGILPKEQFFIKQYAEIKVVEYLGMNQIKALAAIAEAQITAAGYTAENQYRENCGHQIAYCDEDFWNLV